MSISDSDLKVLEFLWKNGSCKASYIKKELEKEKAEAKEKRREFVNKINLFKRNSSKVPKKKAKLDTVQDGQPHAVHTLKKRKPGRSTVTSTNAEGKLNKSVHVITKKKGGTSTRKKK